MSRRCACAFALVERNRQRVHDERIERVDRLDGGRCAASPPRAPAPPARLRLLPRLRLFARLRRRRFGGGCRIACSFARRRLRVLFRVVRARRARRRSPPPQREPAPSRMALLTMRTAPPHHDFALRARHHSRYVSRAPSCKNRHTHAPPPQPPARPVRPVLHRDVGALRLLPARRHPAALPARHDEGRQGHGQRPRRRHRRHLRRPRLPHAVHRRPHRRSLSSAIARRSSSAARSWRSATSCSPSRAANALLFASLGLIIVGNGFFKPNISTLLGNVYNAEELRRSKDAAYNIFYMGINIGAFVCNFVAAILRNHYGWG